MTEPTATIAPDTKDWTWVLATPCPECGFVAADVAVTQLPTLVRDTAAAIVAALAEPDAEVRPRPDRWSVLEYACHVRDVDRVFAERVALMLTEDDPVFPNWDQDATAVADRYHLQDPAEVGAQLMAAAEHAAQTYAAVAPQEWGRRGLRSNGSAFTVESIGRYHVHDLVHHCWDVAQG